MNGIVGIIPSRYGSSRFPGKPLEKILGVSLIERVWRRASECDALDALVVATDDERIAEHVRGFGGEVILTGEHSTGSDRAAEVVRRHPHCQGADIIVNIQGDEPLIDPETIRLVAGGAKEAPLSTAITPLLADQLEQRSVVKCVVDADGFALYFSRAPLAGAHRHIGLYAYQREFLLSYSELPVTPLQLAEDLEQLKVLEQRIPIRCVLVEEEGIGVDTPEDIAKVEACIRRPHSSSSPAEFAPH